MRLLPHGIGVGNQRARLAQAEAALPKPPLALTHAQANLKAPCEPDLERFPIPQRSAQADVARSASQHRLHLQQLCLAQTPGPSGSCPFHQSGQTALFKMSNPVFNRPRGVSQKLADLRAGQPLSDQQHAVKAVIVARFFRTTNLILKSQNHSGGIGDGKWFHDSMKPHFLSMRNYL